MFTAIDLFCGAGGFSIGLKKCGFNVATAIDCWEPAVRTYQRNFTHSCLLTDVREIAAQTLLAHLAGNECDLVVGGPPCQGFSVQRVGANDDERNDLVYEFARVVSTIRPRMFLMENVPGLLGARGRPHVARFRELLIKSGYVVEAQLVNAAEYGVPQVRRRVFFYGWLRERVDHFLFPASQSTPENFRTVSDAIGDLPSPPSDYSCHPQDPLHRRMRMSKLNAERLLHVPPGGGMAQLPTSLRVNAHKNGADRIGHRYVYGRLSPDKPASTITARFDSFTRGKFAHPSEHRNITLREGARLQTFPDDFIFEGTQEQIAALIGNAVPPLLAERICCAVARHLAGETQPFGTLGLSFSVSKEKEQIA